MTCPDLLLEHDPGDAALARSVAAAFHVLPDAVRVVSGDELAVEPHAPLCGYSVERLEHDYGLDLAINTYTTSGEGENGQIMVQLKATERCTTAAEHPRDRWGDAKHMVSIGQHFFPAEVESSLG